MSQKTTKRKPKRKPKRKLKPASSATTAKPKPPEEPVDHVAALKLEAESRRQECGRRVNAALADLACELVGVPIFVDIGEGNHAVRCTWSLSAKVRG